MCKFGFNFSQLYFSLSRVRGKLDLAKKRQIYNKFYFLKSKLIVYIGINVTYYITAKNITQKVV